MRNIEVDLSEERMKKAWEAYKKRWEQEEAWFQELEEKKTVPKMEYLKEKGFNFVFLGFPDAPGSAT